MLWYWGGWLQNAIGLDSFRIEWFHDYCIGYILSVLLFVGLRCYRLYCSSYSTLVWGSMVVAEFTWTLIPVIILALVGLHSLDMLYRLQDKVSMIFLLKSNYWKYLNIVYGIVWCSVAHEVLGWFGHCRGSGVTSVLKSYHQYWKECCYSIIRCGLIWWHGSISSRIYTLRNMMGMIVYWRLYCHWNIVLAFYLVGILLLEVIGSIECSVSYVYSSYNVLDGI